MHLDHKQRPEPDSPSRVLLAEDNAQVRAMVQRALRGSGCRVTAVGNGEAAVEQVRRRDFDLAVLDIEMPGMDGLAVLEVIRSEQPELAVIMATGAATLDRAIRALRAGAVDFLRKPLETVELRRRVEQALETVHLRRQNEVAQREVEQRYRELAAREHARADLADMLLKDLLPRLQDASNCLDLLRAGHGPAMAAEARLLLDCGRSPLRKALRRLRDLVDVYLIGRGERYLDREAWDLAELMLAVVADADGELNLDPSAVPQGLWVHVDAGLMRSGLRGLIRVVDQDGIEPVEAQAHVQGERVVLRLHGRGPRLTAGDLTGSMDLLAGTTGGSLDLALARSVMDAHGVELQARQAKAGRRTLEAVFPRPVPPASCT